MQYHFVQSSKVSGRNSLLTIGGIAGSWNEAWIKRQESIRLLYSHICHLKPLPEHFGHCRVRTNLRQISVTRSPKGVGKQ